MLTSKDNVPGGVGDTRTDENGTPYINIGTGEWDSQKRPSEVRLDRIIRIEPSAVRREGAVMPMDRFSAVVDSVRTDSYLDRAAVRSNRGSSCTIICCDVRLGVSHRDVGADVTSERSSGRCFPAGPAQIG